MNVLVLAQFVRKILCALCAKLVNFWIMGSVWRIAKRESISRLWMVLELANGTVPSAKPIHLILGLGNPPALNAYI